VLRQADDGEVSGVGKRAQHLHAPPLVPAPDEFLVFAKGLGCGQALGIETLPQAGKGIAKGRDATFGGNPSARENDDVLCLLEGNDQFRGDCAGGVRVHGHRRFVVSPTVRLSHIALERR